MSRIAAKRTIDPAALDPAERARYLDLLYSIQTEVFSGVDRKQLAKYVVDSPARITEIELYLDEDGEALGYCAAHFFDQERDGRPVVVMRMEAGLRRCVRGAKVVAPFIARQLIAYRLRHPTAELYYLGSLVHPSSYMGLASGFSETWPRAGTETPPETLAFMISLGDAYGLELVDPAQPLVRSVGWITRDSEEERDYWQHCQRKEARFFVETNPGYVEGHGLLTLIELSVGTMGRSLQRWGRGRLRRTFMAAPGSIRAAADLTDEEITRALAASRELAGVAPEALAAIVDRAERIVVPAQVDVFLQGDQCTAFYVVISGSAQVLVGRSDPELVDQMWEGEVFGDLAVFTNEPRSATIRAATTLKLLKIEQAPLMEVLEDHPAASRALWRNVARERFDTFLRQQSPGSHADSRRARAAWFARGYPLEPGERPPQGTVVFVILGKMQWGAGADWQSVSGPALVHAPHLPPRLGPGARAWVLPRPPA